MTQPELPTLDDILGSQPDVIDTTRLSSSGPAGSLLLTEDMLLNEPSGNLFAMTKNACARGSRKAVS